MIKIRYFHNYLLEYFNDLLIRDMKNQMYYYTYKQVYRELQRRVDYLHNDQFKDYMYKSIESLNDKTK